MKKLFAMSLFALSTLSMFGGNIVNDSNTNNAKPCNNTLEQLQTYHFCYNFKVYIQKVKNFIPNPLIQIMHQEGGLYTESAAQLRMQQLADLYQSEVNEYGAGTIYTYEYEKDPNLSCFQISQ